VTQGTTLLINVGRGGLGGTSGIVDFGGSTSVFSGGAIFNSLYVRGGGWGGQIGTNNAGADGGCGGGGGGYYSGSGTNLGGASIATTPSPPFNSLSIGFNGGSGFGNGTNQVGGGGGGGVQGAGLNNAGNGGFGLALYMLPKPIVVGGGGGGGAWTDAGQTPGQGGGDTIDGVFVMAGGSGGPAGATTNKGGPGVPNTGSGGGGGGNGGGPAGNGSAGRCIIRVTTTLGTPSPISSLTSTIRVQSYLNGFQGYIASYNNASGQIVIGNITNISGYFTNTLPYTINLGSIYGTAGGITSGVTSGPVGWCLECKFLNNTTVGFMSSINATTRNFGNGGIQRIGADSGPFTYGAMPWYNYFCTPTVNAGAGFGIIWPSVGTPVQVIIPTTGYYQLNVTADQANTGVNWVNILLMVWKPSITAPSGSEITTQIIYNFITNGFENTQNWSGVVYLMAGNVIFPRNTQTPLPYIVTFSGFLIK
jgi:hypothetical protein